MEIVERVSLTEDERFNYFHLHVSIFYALQNRVNLSVADQENFRYQFECMRLACLTPVSHHRPDEDFIYTSENAIRKLYEFKKEGEICPICLESGDNDKVDSLTSCSHLFCFKCHELYVRRRQTCPTCTSPLDNLPYAYVSTKFKWIVKRVQEWSSEENTTKLVVVCTK
jgi:RNA polymerase subunit RPABC4/transcription elongation factor Spt4